jgi:cytochrome c oxidase subunit 1
MLALGYLGMPRRYASYQFDAMAPLSLVTTLHRVATVGAFLMAFGILVFAVNVVQSWIEGRQVGDPDPWRLDADDLDTREWHWFADARVAPDGGEEDKPDPAPDADATDPVTDGDG